MPYKQTAPQKKLSGSADVSQMMINLAIQINYFYTGMALKNISTRGSIWYECCVLKYLARSHSLREHVPASTWKVSNGRRTELATRSSRRWWRPKTELKESECWTYIRHMARHRTPNECQCCSYRSLQILSWMPLYLAGNDHEIQLRTMTKLWTEDCSCATCHV